FGSGMATTDHDHIEFLRVKHEKSALNEGQKWAPPAPWAALPRGRLKLLILQAGCLAWRSGQTPEKTQPMQPGTLCSACIK
ncbi:MAG: hypothetical protein NWR85_10645, partial [Limnohabitans sp.]|nr:hypothetical protein [Limnohabitans sp.]